MELQINSLGEEVGRRLLKHRRVSLFGPVDTNSAAAVTTQLLLLDAEEPGDTITLLINSPGGSVDDGLAIYDVMQTISSPVATTGLGLAASMGQFLLCAGAAGQRRVHRHANVLMHQPHGSMQGVATDIAIHAEHFARTRLRLAQLTAMHTGQTVERITADADRDRWFDAEEALAYGMVDEILT